MVPRAIGLPAGQAEQAFAKGREDCDGVTLFPLEGVAGEGISFHGVAALPAIDAPLAQRFVVLLCRHHRNVLGDAHFSVATVWADAMRLEAVKDQQVAGFERHFDDVESGGIGFVVIAVFGLGEFPGIVAAEEFGNALKATHVLVGLVGEGEDALDVLGFCFGIVVPMNKSFVFESGGEGKIKVGAVDRDPEFFRAPDIGKGLVDPGVLSVIPHVLMIVDLHHAGVDEFLHLHIDVGFAIPGGRVVGVFAFVFPEIIGEPLRLFFGDRVFYDDVAVGGPEGPVIFGENAEGRSVAAIVEFLLARFGGGGVAGNLFVRIDGGGLRVDDGCRCHG